MPKFTLLAVYTDFNRGIKLLTSAPLTSISHTDISRHKIIIVIIINK